MGKKLTIVVFLLHFPKKRKKWKHRNHHQNLVSKQSPCYHPGLRRVTFVKIWHQRSKSDFFFEFELVNIITQY